MTHKPTSAQRTILRAMADGQELVQHFDVYAGYWNTIGETKVQKRTVDALFYGRMIENSRPLRVFSGRQRMVFRLTEAGRSVLRGDAALPQSSRASETGGKMADWQPILSAPRDGTPVLLWAEAWDMTWGIQIGQSDGSGWQTSEGSVPDNDEDFDPDAEIDSEEEFDEDANLGPTHWMPLPAPPRSSSGERQDG